MVPTLHGTGVPEEGNLGKGKLIDIISAEVFEEINGEYYLTFKYPVTGALYNDLLEGGVVAAAHPLSLTGVQWKYRSQWFDIVSHTTEIDGIVEFRAEHCSRRLSRQFNLGSFPAQSNAASWVWNDALTELLYAQPRTVDGMAIAGAGIGTFPSPVTYTVVPFKSTLASMIGSEESRATLYGQEFAFDCSFYAYAQGVHTPGTVTAYVYFQGRGKDRGVSIRRGVNMLSLEHTIDKSNAFNAVIPYWNKPGGGFKTAANGSVNNLIVQPTTPISPVIVAGLDCTDQFDTEPTEAQLVAYAQEWLDTNQPWLPIDSLSVDFANDIIEGNDEIYIGDTIHVSWPDADISATMRVHSYKFDVLAEKYTELNLGTPQTEYVAVTGDTFAGATGGGSGGGSSGAMTLLWTNPSPAANFGAQTIAVDLSGFDACLISFHNFASSSAQYGLIAQECIIGEKNVLQFVDTSSNNRNGRRFATVTTTGVEFTACTFNNGTNNGYGVPYQIYGIKY